MDKIPVCVAYEYDGNYRLLPVSGNVLNKAVPVYEYLDGWKEDIQSVVHIRASGERTQIY